MSNLLYEFRSTNITWDKATRRIYSPITANASDSNGRKLNIQVVNSGQVENLTGATLHLYWETKDKTQHGLDAFTASDISKGEFELFYTTGMLSNVGELNATLVLVDSTGKVVSDWFKITVSRGINEGAIESENSFSSLTQALIDISNLEQNYAPRLNGLTAQLQQTITQQEFDSWVATILDGGPSIFFDTLNALQTTYPDGAAGVALVRETDPARIYVWNGSAWQDFGDYQGLELKDRSVTSDKLNYSSVGAIEINSKSESVNILKRSEMIEGSYYFAEVGNQVAVLSSSDWLGTQAIPVSAGDVVRFNQAYQNAYFVGVNDSGVVVQKPVSASPAAPREVVVASGVTNFYAAVTKENFGTTMITINNQMPSFYISGEPKKQLDWLELKDRSVTSDKISDSLLEMINSGSDRYFGSDGVIAGDSIVAGTGTNPTGTEVLIGYDGILIPKLGLNSLENIGISGRPMAEGTANGVGTHTTVTSADINWLTKKFLICNAGTNDFKLNIPIGEIQNMRSAFDVNTYIGAYQKTIEYVLTQNPEIEIVILTPAQRNNGGYSTETTNSAGHKLIDYVNAAKAVGEKYSATVVDIYSDSGISEFKINAFTYDGLHFNNKGYEKAGRLTVKKMMYG